MTEGARRRLREIVKYHIIIPKQDESRPKVPTTAELETVEDDTR